MNRRLIGLFAVVLVVLVAGCSSGGGLAPDVGTADGGSSPAEGSGSDGAGTAGGGSTPATDDGSASDPVSSGTGSDGGSTDTAGTPGAGTDWDSTDGQSTPASGTTPTDDGTGGATATPGPAATGPAGSAQDLARTDPEATLQAAGSYTSNWTFRTNRAAEHDATTMVFRQQVDVGSERAFSSIRIVGDEVQLFENLYADGMQYTRVSTDSGSQVTYMGGEMPFDSRSSAVSYGFVYDYSVFERYSYAGTETFDGVPVSRFVFDATEAWLAAEQVADQGMTVESAHMEMLVDADGIPRYQRYRVEGTDSSGAVWYDFEFTITDVGSTTVPDPAWLGEAQQQVR